LVTKFSAILIPSASAMQAQQDQEGLRDMLCRRSEQASSFTVPALLWVAFLGGPFVGLWMGPEYFHPWLVPVLSLGFLATLVQDPIWAIMAGLNRHGRIALWKLAGGAVAAGCVALALNFSSDKLVGAALGLTIPFLIVDGVIVPMLACRELNVAMSRFYQLTLWRPLKVFLPAGIILAGARIAFAGEPLKALIVGGTVGGLVQAAVFYRLVLPQRMKTKMRARVLALAGRA
jgi:O-antigen/teichoic acid export membrane protein